MLNGLFQAFGKLLKILFIQEDLMFFKKWPVGTFRKTLLALRNRSFSLPLPLSQKYHPVDHCYQTQPLVVVLLTKIKKYSVLQHPANF
jgi:hypothetical protein